MNGWEINDFDISDALSFDNKLLKKLKQFVTDYKLSALSKNEKTVVIIRKYHPRFNCSPDDDNWVIKLAYGSSDMQTSFLLPSTYTYTGIKIDENDTITISTTQGEKQTNLNELNRKLWFTEPQEEENIIKIYDNLINDRIYNVPKVINQTEIYSEVLGVMKQGDFDDWWISNPVSIPYLNNLEVKITFINFNPDEDISFLKEADTLLVNFLNKNEEQRLLDSKYVYENCIEFLNSVECYDTDEPMLNMKKPEKVWDFVKVTDVLVSRSYYKDENVYIQILFDCEWEEEHGLQMVFNSEGRLTRVSPQDGHLHGDSKLDGKIELEN